MLLLCIADGLGQMLPGGGQGPLVVLGSLHVIGRAVGGHGSRFCCRTTVGDVARQLLTMEAPSSCVP